MLRALMVMAVLWASGAQAETFRMAVTTSFHNSGLADVLLPEIAKDTGLQVQLLAVGTGQALRLGRAGDVDAILVHSRAAEEAFVADGYGTKRTEIMYNDFVIVGPLSDPAKLSDAQTAVEALGVIAASQSDFVSRGDDSGTHKKEISLWSSAGLYPQEFGRWYKAVGAGMGASLTTASGLGAYILADRASWLNFKNKDGMGILFAGDPELFNQYAYLPVNAAKHPHVNTQGAETLEAWLTSHVAAQLINGYTIDGERLFVFNAQE